MFETLEIRPSRSARRRVIGDRRGRGASNNVLPYWYPRTPLRDITVIVLCCRAFSSRKLVRRMRFSPCHLSTKHPLLPNSYYVQCSSSSPGAHLEHTDTTKTPAPRTAMKRCPPSVNKVSKILLAVTNKPSKDSEFLTPQKKLLNSIDTVEKQVKQVLQKQQRTSSAKKAERERKVRTLLSLR